MRGVPGLCDPWQCYGWRWILVLELLQCDHRFFFILAAKWCGGVADIRPVVVHGKAPLHFFLVFILVHWGLLVRSWMAGVAAALQIIATARASARCVAWRSA